jgi:AraC-like DNA-binding protein
MARATQLVEQHITDPAYNVERLAADLCMERAGLYKRLTALMQQSPVAFIRSIRLHRAADMLLRGDLSVTEISERTGFGSTSYFSKCFQKEFGCKPSEYTGA